jgi:hypothetical protein
LLGALVLLLAAGPAWGCKTTTASQFDWEHCWSYQRLSYAGLGVIASFLFSFLVVFPLRIGHWRSYPTTPWPWEAYGQSLALAIVLGVCSFLIFFGWVEDELRREPVRLFPSSLYWLNLNARWLGILLAGIVAALLVCILYRHRGTAPKPAARS